MRNDQLEEFAADIAETVARVTLAAGLDLVGLSAAQHIAQRAAEAARTAAKNGVARYTALHIEADTATVVDLRT